MRKKELPQRSDVPNQSIHRDAIHIVQFLQRLLNLSLVRLDIADENQRIILLDLLHRALGVERADNDLVCIEAGFMRDGFSGISGRARELEGLGSVECCAQADFADFLAVDLEGLRC